VRRLGADPPWRNWRPIHSLRRVPAAAAVLPLHQSGQFVLSGRTDFGPCLPVACRMDTLDDVVLHYHRPTLFNTDTDIPEPFIPRPHWTRLLLPRHTICNNNVFMYTALHYFYWRPAASVKREGSQYWKKVLGYFPLAQATKLDFQNKLATTPTAERLAHFV
jgi:hypothetical protein